MALELEAGKRYVDHDGRVVLIEGQARHPSRPAHRVCKHSQLPIFYAHAGNWYRADGRFFWTHPTDHTYPDPYHLNLREEHTHGQG